jgi:hypothetical protein
VQAAVTHDKLLLLARMFAKNPNGPGLVDHVTSTGRALSVGKVTRKSWGVRKRARGEVATPLPIGVSVHPMRLTPTPRHPDCEKRRYQYGTKVWLLNEFKRPEDYTNGCGLQTRKARWQLVASATGKVLGYHPEAQYALGWAMAARDRGVNVALIDRE